MQDRAIVMNEHKLIGTIVYLLSLMHLQWYTYNLLDVKEKQAKVVKEVITTVRENIGPVASFKDVIIVPRLPKTRSGKIARNTLAAIAAGQPYKVNAMSHTPSLALPNTYSDSEYRSK